MRRPNRVAEGLLTVAVRAIPAGEQRRRYERELFAELHTLPSRQRARFALGVLVTAWSLRRAVRGRSLAGPPPRVALPRKALLCGLNLHHHWLMHSAPDGDLRYWRCTRCGKERFARSTPPPGTPVAMMGPSGG